MYLTKCSLLLSIIFDQTYDQMFSDRFTKTKQPKNIRSDKRTTVKLKYSTILQ